jgi:hypothetical protein
MARSEGDRRGAPVRNHFPQKKKKRSNDRVVKKTRYVWKNKSGWCSLYSTDAGIAYFTFGFRTRKEAGRTGFITGQKTVKSLSQNQCDRIMDAERRNECFGIVSIHSDRSNCAKNYYLKLPLKKGGWGLWKNYIGANNYDAMYKYGII